MFDWAAARQDTQAAERRALEMRLARMIRRVALTKDQIAHLPDTYAAAVTSGAFPPRADPRALDRAFLPPDLLDPHGPWLDINDSFTEPIAPQHAATFSHSEFHVRLTVPGGAAATADYLKTLWDYPEPFVAEPRSTTASSARRSTRSCPPCRMGPRWP